MRQIYYSFEDGTKTYSLAEARELIKEHGRYTQKDEPVKIAIQPGNETEGGEAWDPNHMRHAAGPAPSGAIR